MPLANCPLANYKRCLECNCPLVGINERNNQITTTLNKKIRDIQIALNKIPDNIRNFVDSISDDVDYLNQILKKR